MKGISLPRKTFGKIPESASYNPNADINGDDKIDMKDISTVARHFGETADR